MYTTNFQEERDSGNFYLGDNFEIGRLRGINGLSPTYDAIIPRESPSSRSPIGQTPPPDLGLGLDSSPPPHHIGALFSPSFQSEEFHRSLLSPKSFAHSAPGNLSTTARNLSPRLTEEEQFELDMTPSSSDPEKTPSDLSDLEMPWSDSPPFTQQTSGTQSPSYTPGQVHGEHPYGEHPSRTLFVRNIHSSVDDEELRSVFGKHGDIRSMYTQCKHRGFVMISYYDIRDAKTALRQLQNTMICGRKIDIHFSIPKDNPSEKDQNQGTLVIFNLDPSIPNNELQQIFEQYGEIKEIRETPNKKHHKFIEFYDVRDAEKAMKFLNKTEIKGKKIKIEPSRPGRPRKPYRKNSDSPPVEEDRRTNSPVPLQSPPVNWLYMYSSGNNKRAPLTSPTLPASFTGPPGTATVADFPSSPRYYPFSAPPAYYGASPWQTHTAGIQFAPEQRFKRPPLPTARSVRPVSVSTPAVGPSTSPGPAPSVVPIGTTSPSASPSYVSTARETSTTVTKPPESFTPPKKGYKSEGKSRTRDDKHQFALDISQVRSGEERRTTLMIKNIPNKYSQKMLLTAVDVNHKGRYDFFYLPIDFKNKCNVGYAFINFIKPIYILDFYEEFNNKKWERFNSEKVCEITFARIQGKNSLISHFQNSSLMCEDKPYRPIIFHSDGPNVGEIEPFPVGPNIRARSEKSHGETKRDKSADEP